MLLPSGVQPVVTLPESSRPAWHASVYRATRDCSRPCDPNNGLLILETNIVNILFDKPEAPVSFFRKP